MRWLGFIAGAILIVGCIEHMTLPPVEHLTSDFSVGDTTYLPLAPVWGSDAGLVAPVEVSISHARQVFVADTGLHRILVFNFSGERLDKTEPMFSTLDLARIDPGFVPMDIDIDGRLNVLIINGTHTVYRWNQYWNLHGIDSLAADVLFENTTNAEKQWIAADSPLLMQHLNSSDWRALLDSCRFIYDEDRIDSLLYPHILLDMTAPENDAVDQYYSGKKTRFSAISGARLDDDFFYATDSIQNRMVKAYLKRNGVIKLGNSEIMYTHTARFGENSVDRGTGAGTLNRPSGLDVDKYGNIYYTQFGEFVYVHSVAPDPAFSYPSNFELLIHEIMDSDWYASPCDIAVDEDQMIYIANTGAAEVLVFNGDGEFFKKAGVTTEIVDTTYWVYDGPDSAQVDTFFVREIKGELEMPVSLDVDDRGVIYICDPARSSVFRYTLSTNLDENLVGQDQ